MHLFRLCRSLQTSAGDSRLSSAWSRGTRSSVAFGFSGCLAGLRFHYYEQGGGQLRPEDRWAQTPGAEDYFLSTRSVGLSRWVSSLPSGQHSSAHFVKGPRQARFDRNKLQLSAYFLTSTALQARTSAPLSSSPTSSSCSPHSFCLTLWSTRR